MYASVCMVLRMKNVQVFDQYQCILWCQKSHWCSTFADELHWIVVHRLRKQANTNRHKGVKHLYVYVRTDWEPLCVCDRGFLRRVGRALFWSFRYITTKWTWFETLLCIRLPNTHMKQFALVSFHFIVFHSNPCQSVCTTVLTVWLLFTIFDDHSVKTSMNSCGLCTACSLCNDPLQFPHSIFRNSLPLYDVGARIIPLPLTLARILSPCFPCKLPIMHPFSYFDRRSVKTVDTLNTYDHRHRFKSCCVVAWNLEFVIALGRSKYAELFAG